MIILLFLNTLFSNYFHILRHCDHTLKVFFCCFRNLKNNSVTYRTREQYFLYSDELLILSRFNRNSWFVCGLLADCWVILAITHC